MPGSGLWWAACLSLLGLAVVLLLGHGWHLLGATPYLLLLACPLLHLLGHRGHSGHQRHED